MNDKIIPKFSGTCISCGTKLKGNYCHKCGEKVLNPSKDYSLLKFLEQTLDAFSHLDSKFLRTFWALLSNPGLLTAEFIRGRRTLYMKPVQIFIITGILFYFIYPHSSTFYQSVEDMTRGNILKYDVTHVLQKKMISDNAEMEQVMKAVNLEAAQKSKAYLFLLIPFWGITMYLLFRKSVSFLVPHVVFAVHSLSFFILLFLIYITVFNVFGGSNFTDLQLIPLVAIFLIYLFIGIRRVYLENLVLSIIKSIASLSVFVILIIFYRQVITAWALNW